MSGSIEMPELAFDAPFDERAQMEAKARGYLSHVSVVMTNGDAFPVVFYDCVRLAQDLEYEVSTGRMCIAERGMIILPEVTLDNILAAVRSLFAEGYFESPRLG